MKTVPILMMIFFSFFLSQEEPFDGFTLFNPLIDSTTFMIDLDHNVIHSWDCNSRPASTPYLMQDSTLIIPLMMADTYISGSGVGGLIQKIDWNGSVLWSFLWSDINHQQHHDIAVMPNGNILILSWERKTYAEAIAAGRVDIMGEIWPTEIIEVEPVGDSGGNIVWEWHLWDHLIQDVNPAFDNYGVVADHPELLNINFGELGDGPLISGDWLHANALEYNEQLDQIMFCSRNLGEFYIIDHSTTTEEAAGHSGGNSGKGGDFLYRWGNPMVYDQGEPSDQKLFSAHATNWIPEDYPGAGNILLFNNGYNRPDGNYSTVEEIIPPIIEGGNYLLSEENTFLPEESDIIYEDQDNFYSAQQSGAYRLPNGNTLISEANDGYFFELAPSGEIVWEYEHPGGVSIARGIRYGFDYLDSSFVQCDEGYTQIDSLCYWQEDLDVLQLIIDNSGLSIEPIELGAYQDWSQGRLVELGCYGSNLSGAIPSEIGNLTNIEFLNFGSNSLSGSIPPEIGNLSELTTLYLNNNEISGSIPPEMGNLLNLEILYIYDNQLSGSVPAELGNLLNLEKLYLHLNQLSGSLPSELGTLDNLERLDFKNNQFEGEIPPEFGNLSSLIELFLNDNQLEGIVPAEIGALENLDWIWLFNNNFTGISDSVCNLNIVWSQMSCGDTPFFMMGNNNVCGFIPECIDTSAFLNFVWNENSPPPVIVPQNCGWYIPGDVNLDETVDILDPVMLVFFIMESVIFDQFQQINADVNSDGMNDVADIVMIVDIIL